MRNLLCALAVVGVAGICRASVITSSPVLPPNTGAYVTADGVNTVYNAGPLVFVLSHVQHGSFSSINRIASGADESESFSSEATGLVSVNGGPNTPVDLTGPCGVLVHNKIGQVTGTFDTEMTSLSLSGISGGNPVFFRESPTLASTGSTTITDIGGGDFRIDSFFDIFTELSIDGGSTWVPSTSSTHVVLSNLPEPATLSLLGLPMMLLMRRKRD